MTAMASNAPITNHSKSRELKSCKKRESCQRIIAGASPMGIGISCLRGSVSLRAGRAFTGRVGAVPAVLQLLQREITAAEWLFHQEKATSHTAGDAM